jgi:hypothetical protein
MAYKVMIFAIKGDGPKNLAQNISVCLLSYFEHQPTLQSSCTGTEQRKLKKVRWQELFKTALM